MPAPTIPQARLQHMQGWKLWLTLTCLYLGLLMSTLETSIIATALVTISNELGDFSKSNWVVTSYLITYTGFLIVFARLSDLFGRKTILISSLVIFTVFSLACGLAETMVQLIIFRAFQGIGGAGLYSLAMAVITEITPLKNIAAASGLMGMVFASSSLLGPLLGGAITTNSDWRWVFWLNIPPGTATLALIILYFPENAGPLPITKRTFMSVDYFGITTSLTGTILLIFALEMGGLFYPWDSVPIVSALVIGGVSFIIFAIWQWNVSDPVYSVAQSVLPLFPAHLVGQRVLAFSLLTAFLAGFPFMSTLIFLPQRLQLQNARTPVQAGVSMLPLLVVSAFGSAITGAIASKKNISWYILMTSIALQMLGLGLMSTLPTTAGPVTQAQYGYQAILGLGFGLALSSVVILVRMETERKDLSIVMGTVTQVRVLGGVIGIAICQAMLVARLTGDLGPVIGADKLAELLRSTSAIETFSSEDADTIREFYGRTFNTQNYIMIGFCGASAVSCMCAWKRNWQEAADRERKYLEEESGGDHKKEDMDKMVKMSLKRLSTAPALAPPPNLNRPLPPLPTEGLVELGGNSRYTVENGPRYSMESFHLAALRPAAGRPGQTDPGQLDPGQLEAGRWDSGQPGHRRQQASVDSTEHFHAAQPSGPLDRV